MSRECSPIAPLVLAAGLLVSSSPAAAQTGAVAGTVLSTSADEPVPGAQVSVRGAGIGTLTDADGRFVLLSVPTGRQTLRIQRIGFGDRTRDVTVLPEETVRLTIRLEPEAIALQEIVVTGVAGATERAKVPFDVATLRSAELVVPQTDPLSAMQAKMPGVSVVKGSGRPGAAPSILLRGPTSINAVGRNQEPLYIVDGVILGSGIVDIDALDIASIEIVKGAAAASLYGSRAANGVIQITTKRGNTLPDDHVRYTFRSDYGWSELGQPPEALVTEAHHYALTGDGLFVDAQSGQPCEWLECGQPSLAGQEAAQGEGPSEWNTFQTQAWPGRTYDQVDRFFEPGQFVQHFLGADGRSGSTNFHLSLSNLDETGVLPGLRGFDRTGFRMNLDHSLTDGLEVSGSAYYARSDGDRLPQTGGIGTNPLFALTRVPAGIDLLARNEQGELLLRVDPTSLVSNPLYGLLNRESTEERGRFLGGTNLRWSPTAWLQLDGNISYDRLDVRREDLVPKGFRAIDPDLDSDGSLSLETLRNEALNGSLTATLDLDLSESIRNRTQLRYLQERQDYDLFTASGNDFAVEGVPVLDNLDQTTVTSESERREILADGYFLISNFEILDRYVVDGLIRNDGSSLFGEDERRQWYYRLAGAWRMAQEPWFPLDAVDELKLRYSLGTAGGRPNYYAQYETYSVSGGRISRLNLGNKDLKPEHSVEHEVGMDVSVFGGRVLGTVTYAESETNNQILPVPLPATTGFARQWRNVGTLSSDTWELSLQANLVRTRDLQWSTRLIYDQTRSRIVELDVPPFQYGVAGQALGDVFYAREGEEFGTFYGIRFATSCTDLPDDTPCDGFEVDHNGWLVWVGDADFDDPGWGTESAVTVRGETVPWGTPFAGECTDPDTGERTLFCAVGNTIPDYTVSLSSSLRWKGLSLYGLLQSSRGFDVYNQPLQWALFARYAGIMDQRRVPEHERKPLGYWDALYTVSGLRPSNAFVEDASYLKLRELSASYRFGSDVLDAIPWLDRFSRVTLRLTGRNLFTWTDYRGYDPEVGKAGGDVGSAAIARVEGYQYPNFRTWIVGIDLGF